MRKLVLLAALLFGLFVPLPSAAVEQIPPSPALFLPAVAAPDLKEEAVLGPIGRYITLDAGDYIQIFCNRGDLVSQANSGIVYCKEK